MDRASGKHAKDWQDDQTMDVFFSPFRENRQVNPQSWDSKIAFWRDNITEHCVNANTVVVNSKLLPQVFSRKGKTPVCLDVVIDSMQQNGDLMNISDYEKASSSSWMSWGFGVLVQKPLSWTYGALVKKPLTAMFGSGEDTGQNLIMIELLKVKAAAILHTHQTTVDNELTDRVVGYNTLAHQCKHLCADQLTFDLAVTQLMREGKCAVLDTEKGEKVLRFAKSNKRSVTPPTDCDMKLYRLKNAERLLHEQIEKLTQDMDSCRLEAKQYLRKGIKSSAKACLRKKKRLEAIRDGKETAVNNVHHMLTIIQQADDNKMILDAYSSGSEAFKLVTQKYGLTTDMVDDVMDSVQQVHDDSEEINQTLAAGSIATDEPSVADLEAELSDLLSGGDVEELPCVPPHQELVDAMCKMNVIGGEAGLDASLDLPEVPIFDPMTPPSSAVKVTPERPYAATFTPQGQSSAQNQPLLG